MEYASSPSYLRLGKVTDLFQPGVYGYGKDPFAPKGVVSHLATARSLNKTINKNFGSIVFCRRYLERLGVGRYLAGVSIRLVAGSMECLSLHADEQSRLSGNCRGLSTFDGYPRVVLCAV